MEAGCSMQNLFKSTESKTEQQQNMFEKKIQHVLARGQISVSALKEVFYGRRERIL